MSEIKWKQVIVTTIIVGLIVGLLVGLAFPREVSTDYPAANETICPEVNGTANCPEVDAEGCSISQTCEEQEQEIIMATGYMIDDLFLETAFSETLSDREIYLFDGEIEFDGDDYNADEFLTLTDLTLKANAGDFDGDVYLTIPTEGISYIFRVETGLNTSAIDDGEILELRFLGEDITISEWGINEVTFTQGAEYLLDEEESIVINGKNITLDLVLNEFAYVTVDGKTEEIEKGDTKTIGSLEIKAKNVLYDTRSDRVSKATLIIGENIETTVSNGESYGKDEIWNWAISESSIGITLANQYIDVDEDYNALTSEEILCLPNDYVCILYNGIVGGDEEEYRLNFDSGDGFTEVKGNLFTDSEEYDRVYIDTTTGIIYEDDNINTEINNTINLGDTDSILEVSATEITINDFVVSLVLDIVNIDDYENYDADYLTDYGILVNNPKDSIEEYEFTITVPEEKLEGIITVKKGGFEESVCDVDNLDLCLDETTCTDATGYWYDDTCNLEEVAEE